MNLRGLKELFHSISIQPVKNGCVTEIKDGSESGAESRVNDECPNLKKSTTEADDHSETILEVLKNFKIS